MYGCIIYLSNMFQIGYQKEQISTNHQNFCLMLFLLDLEIHSF